MAAEPQEGAAGLSARFLPGLALLPTFAAVTTLALYLADWPEGASGGVIAGIGLGIGVAAWLVVSLLFFGPFTRIESAVGDTYDQLRTRVLSLRARIEVHKSAPAPATGNAAATALAEAGSLVDDLERELGPESPASQKWLLATGYVNLWRRVHRAEEALLELAPKEELFVTALRDRRLLGRSRVSGAAELGAALDDVLGDADGREPSAVAREKALTALDTPYGRTLTREAEHALHSHHNDVWDKLVNLRNRLVATLFVTTLGTYALLAVAVLMEADPDAVAGATVFFVVGAGIGLFRELYATSRRRGGVVFDYGLGYARLLTVPVLSGIAAIGGVALTRLGAASTDEMPQLSEVYSLEAYPFGLVVAAIFGLTPSLLLERLRSRTDEYQEQIKPTGEAPTAPTAPGDSEHG
jgi:hypothetical protein